MKKIFYSVALLGLLISIPSLRADSNALRQMYSCSGPCTTAEGKQGQLAWDQTFMGPKCICALP